MRWPLPALLAWGAAWALFAALRSIDVAPPAAVLCATLLGAGAAAFDRFAASPSRRVLVGAGFPLSLAASGAAAAVPAWSWLLPLVLLLALYPLKSWRDAPFYPTPRAALAGLAERVAVAPGRRIVDAGCGLGDGLLALRAAYPQARLEGLEWSWPLRWACAWRCRFAHVRRADLWAVDWSAYDLVYLFQRPESMPQAALKAARELHRGAWLVSLEFALPACTPQAVLHGADGRCVYAYQAPFVAA
jgi:SAM-dependent methyltransferase